MSRLSEVCRLCLTIDVRMINISGIPLQNVYEKITGTKLHTTDLRPLTLCYVCHARLKQSYKLMEMSAKAEIVLTEVLKKHNEITKESMAVFNRQAIGLSSTLAMTPAEYHEISQRIVDVQVEIKREMENTTGYNDENAEMTTLSRGVHAATVTKQDFEIEFDDRKAESANNNIKDEQAFEDAFECTDTRFLKMDCEKQNNAKTSSREEEDNNLTPSESQNETESLLPPRSKDKYLAAYETFLEWSKSKNVDTYSESVFMDYFKELDVKYKPSSLWCIFSMLKSTFKTKNNIDLTTYGSLTAFLKRRSDGYIPKKSKVLSLANVEKFLKEAPDFQYLATKVALIFGVTGACRRQELNDLTTKDVQTHGEMLLVKIANNRNKIPRTFTISGPFYEIVKKYQSLRSTKSKSDRFFQNFQKGKCTVQPIGLNKFGAMPKEIAKYLQLPDAESYTGHSFRRTSATLLDSGADVLTLKRHGGWQSDTLSDHFIEESIDNAVNSAKTTNDINLGAPTKKLCMDMPSTSHDTGHLAQGTPTSESEPFIPPTFTQENEVINNHTIQQNVKMPIIYNFNNCTFNNVK